MARHHRRVQAHLGGDLTPAALPARQKLQNAQARRMGQGLPHVCQGNGQLPVIALMHNTAL